MTAPGLILAAPASGSGKTLITLALLRRLRDRGVRVAAAKVGPDYIDPAFHAAASGAPCRNLDPWAMRSATLALLIGEAGREAELLLVEGVMGLFDGAGDGRGSTADLAAFAGWPVVLIVDAAGQGASAAALAQGFRDFRADVAVAGIIFNRVAGEAHAAILRRAVEPLGLPVLGCLPRAPALALPSRHLGLVQAREHADLDGLIDRAAAWAAVLDLDALQALARPSRVAGAAQGPAPPLPPLGQRIALAGDDAFAFAYPHVIEAWRGQGAELLPFSPLADEAPDTAADAVYLPGGYPELQAGRLAANARFLKGLRDAAARGAVLYGECGGYMALGAGLTDVDGRRHAMAGLLPVETAFTKPRLHLGYRRVTLAESGPLGAAGAAFRGHEFHYATIAREDAEAPLFTGTDSAGRALGPLGARRGRVMGSFVHLVDRV
ncbi:MAG TPA: cobyrinate a,c-diamide synthase [Alphaproteobacteria bacterium]|nr:cobyrinate a,c-diamide synthase [Alphaproteobacteria bacterium]